MKEKIKVILMWAFVACFFAAFFVVPIVSHIKKNEKIVWTDCPVCGTRVKEEDIDPAYALEWLEKEGYDVIKREDSWEYVWEHMRDDSDLFHEIMDNWAAEYLQEKGWELIEPGES